MALYEHELQIAIHAVREAALLTRSVADAITPEVLEKKDRSPVTLADFGSQAIVCRALAAAFPTDPVVGEEESSGLRQEGQAGMLARLVEAGDRGRSRATRGRRLAWLHVVGRVPARPARHRGAGAGTRRRRGQPYRGRRARTRDRARS